MQEWVLNNHSTFDDGIKVEPSSHLAERVVELGQGRGRRMVLKVDGLDNKPSGQAIRLQIDARDQLVRPAKTAAHNSHAFACAAGV